jgi:hypothetical protein
MKMSAKIMGEVWDLVLSPAERSVLLAMADHADHNGDNVRPSVALIAWKTDYSERQVQRIIGDLRKAGILIIMHGATPTTPNHYRINIAAGEQKKAFVPAKRGRHFVTPIDTKQRGDILSPGDIAMSQRGDIAMSPDPSLNHHKEKVGATRATAPAENKTKTPAPIVTALADVCKIDQKLGTKEQKLQLYSTAKSLHEAGISAGKTPDEIAETIRYVGAHWKGHNWKGKKDKDAIPWPKDIREHWRVAIEARGKNGHIAGDLPLISATPRQTPEERAAAASRRRAILDERSAGK